MRKDYQISEDLKPKNEINHVEKGNQPQQNNGLSKEEEKFRRELDFFAFKESDADHNMRKQVSRSHQKKQLIEENKEERKDDTFNCPQKIEFDKKMTKVAMPDRF